MQEPRHRLAAALLGVVVAGMALWWVARCVQAERASLLYAESCYGSSSNDVRLVLAQADRASAIDRNHYHFWALAAEDAWNARRTASITDVVFLGERARYWCRKTLDVNPWHPKTRVLWAEMLAERNPGEALRYWQTCVDWQYWEPFNHAFLAELLGRSGDFAQASNALDRIKGKPYYSEMRSILDRMASNAVPR